MKFVMLKMMGRIHSLEEQLKQELDEYLRVLLPAEAWESAEILDLKAFVIEPHSWGVYQASENAAWMDVLDEHGDKIPVVARESEGAWDFRVPGFTVGFKLAEEARYDYANTATLEANLFIRLVTGAIL